MGFVSTAMREGDSEPQHAPLAVRLFTLLTEAKAQLSGSATPRACLASPSPFAPRGTAVDVKSPLQTLQTLESTPRARPRSRRQLPACRTAVGCTERRAR